MVEAMAMGLVPSAGCTLHHLFAWTCTTLLAITWPSHGRHQTTSLSIERACLLWAACGAGLVLCRRVCSAHFVVQRVGVLAHSITGYRVQYVDEDGNTGVVDTLSDATEFVLGSGQGMPASQPFQPGTTLKRITVAAMGDGRVISKTCCPAMARTLKPPSPPRTVRVAGAR